MCVCVCVCVCAKSLEIKWCKLLSTLLYYFNINYCCYYFDGYIGMANNFMRNTPAVH